MATELKLAGLDEIREEQAKLERYQFNAGTKKQPKQRNSNDQFRSALGSQHKIGSTNLVTAELLSIEKSANKVKMRRSSNNDVA